MYVGDYDEFQAVPRTAGLEAEGEETEVLEIPLEDAFSMIADGDIVDMKTIILIQALMLERLHKKQQ
ncbi:hypothetical protein C8J32_10810 [Rhizobium sp. PP-CC-3A-592]|nr:hypothetical protein C8J32_10810 [Rhizobium sp. PP-CC-3A-592]